MNIADKIIKKSIPENARVICISDIHGCNEALDALLEKCGYDKEKDFLFILGDEAEKGGNNIAAVRRVKELCANERTVCIKGNNDTMCPRMAYTDTKEKFLSRLERRPFNCYMEMARSLGLGRENFESGFEESRKKVNEAFKEELGFLESLPLAIETEDYIFVHAGIENRPDWQNTSERFALTEPWFFNNTHQAEKTVICGHYPTYNYEAANNTNLPIIDKNKKIICIDGGAATKWAGQLNAFIINRVGGTYEYETVFEPISARRTVKRSVKSDVKPIYVNWESDLLTVAEKRGDFLRVIKNGNGETGLICEKFCGEWDGSLHGWVNLNIFISVNEGEDFAVAGETENYFFGIAENGQVGYVPKSCM